MNFARCDTGTTEQVNGLCEFLQLPSRERLIFVSRRCKVREDTLKFDSSGSGKSADDLFPRVLLHSDPVHAGFNFEVDRNFRLEAFSKMVKLLNLFA